MRELGRDRVALETENGVSVWMSGWFVVAITKDMLYAKRFDTQNFREKAVRNIQAGEPVKSALGLLTKSISLDAIKSVCQVPGLGIVVVRGGLLKEALRLEFPEEQTPTEIFETLKARCSAASEVQTAKASVNDVPFDPRLGLTILLGFVGVGCIIGGALEQGPLGGIGKARFLEEFGRLLGPLPAFLLGGFALALAVFFTVRWWKSLSEKRFFTA